MAGPIIIVLPFTPTNGNTLIAAIGTAEPVGGGSVSDIVQAGVPNWTQGGITTIAGKTVELWYAQNISGASVTITINLVAGVFEATAEVIEAEGLVPAPPAVDRSAGATGTSAAADSGTTPVTRLTPQLLVAAFVAGDGFAMSAPTNDFELVAEESSGAGATDVNTGILRKSVTVIGAANTGVTLAGSTDWAGLILTFIGIAPVILVGNRAPAPFLVGKVTDSFRFSLRTQGEELNRLTLNTFIGAGFAFYGGDILPEDEPDKTFVLEAFPDNADGFATRTIESGGELTIDKDLASTNQRATYSFGRLESPADPEGILMMEATLLLNAADVTPDVNDLSGVQFGFFINDTGMAVKFLTDGAVQSIEIHDAGVSTITPPSGVYVSDFDWNGKEHTYKVLWHPALDIVKLYLSTGQEGLVSDILLIEGSVSDFTTLPPNEIRANQPVAFFGHGALAPTSISRWASVSFQSLCSTAILGGIPQGEHTGTIKSDNETFYDGSTLPRDASSAWTLLPSGFGTISGQEFVTIDQELHLLKTDPAASFGFFRVEPEVGFSTTVVDFTIRGRVIEPDPASESSGIEVYVDDGAQSVVVAFLQDAGGNQFIGMFESPGTSPESISSYSVVQTGWSVSRDYRIVFEKGLRAQLFELVPQLAGPEEILLIELLSAELPTVGLPGPGIGFLHNNNSAAAQAEFFLDKLRYLTRVVNVEMDTIPLAPWSLLGPTESLSGSWTWDTTTTVLSTDTSGVVIGDFIMKDSDGQPFEIFSIVPNTSVVILNPDNRNIPTGLSAASKVFLTATLDESVLESVLTIDQVRETQQFMWLNVLPAFADQGITLEFQAKVNSFSVDAGVSLDPIREVTPVGVGIDDGTFATVLIFADAGPSLGKILFLATGASLDGDQNLLDIRSGLSAVEGTHVSVDWSEYHLYRFEKTVGGRLRVFIDNADEPAIDFDQASFSLPATLGSGPFIFWGAISAGSSNSSWKHIRYSIATGFDVDLRPVSFEDELRFDHAFNVIVEAEDTAP